MSDLSHIGPDGGARMVDVSAKPATDRLARAGGTILMSADTLAAIKANTLLKGDVLTVARTAGILAAKRTAELIPLCHPLPLTDIAIAISPDESLPGITVESTVRTTAPTGVEMEAITAVSVTLITIYDMVKSVDKGLRLTDIRLLEKRGGRSGVWIAR
ncbi:MAG TPA: cyclic pyranopterin monophosphate synthase MoaC [Gemmatimonadaceae bacterium]|nr:cyclic pyranopterin monophosphate synthase MoaC [Gemmatimonadaceae bacterium]